MGQAAEDYLDQEDRAKIGGSWDLRQFSPIDPIAKSDDFVSLSRAEVEALMEEARAFQMIRAVWTDPHNDNLMRKASMTLDALRERMK